MYGCLIKEVEMQHYVSFPKPYSEGVIISMLELKGQIRDLLIHYMGKWGRRV